MEFNKEQLTKTEVLFCKKRKDLLELANECPGVLGAHFLLQVRKKLMKPLPSNSQELLLTDVASWAATSTHCDIKEIRDAKEVQMLGRIIGLMGEGKYEEIVDLAVMRVREVRFAKQPSSSWD